MPKNPKKAEQAVEGIVNIITGIAGKLEKGSPNNPFKVAPVKELTAGEKIVRRKMEELNPKMERVKGNKKPISLSREEEAKVIQNTESKAYNIDKMIAKNPDIADNLNNIASAMHKNIIVHFPIGIVSNKQGGKSTILTMNNQPIVRSISGKKQDTEKLRTTPITFLEDIKNVPKDYYDISPNKQLLATDTYLRLYLKLHNIDKNKGDMFLSMYKDWDGPIWDLYQNIKNMPGTPQAKL